MWGAHLLRPPPALREVHFWCIFPEDVQSPALVKAYENFLCLEERKHVLEAPAENVQKERLLARALVRTTLARYSNGLVDPASLKFRKNKFGKPEVIWPDMSSKVKLPTLDFNLSHTHSLVACGVAVSSPLGVDVEYKRRVFKGDFMQLARRRFSMKEVSWLETFTDTDEQRHRFLQLWTLKEAYVKALGKGIHGAPLRNFSFHFSETPAMEQATQLSTYPEAQTISLESLKPDDAASWTAIRDWQFLLFEPSPEHYASICFQQCGDGDRRFKFWRTIPLVADAPLVDGAALAWSEESGAKEEEESWKSICFRVEGLALEMKRACTTEDDGQAESKVARIEQSGMQRYLVAVEYIGTRFSGWQKQEGARTVQGVLEDAFAKFVGHPVSSAGSSRTDAGVHALANVCHVDVVRTSKRKPGEVLAPHAPEVVVRAVNHFLQKDAADVQVIDVKLVASDFHARFRAKGRTYYYRILAGNGLPPLFEKDRAWHVTEDLNLKAIQDACKILVGNHDFSSFRASGCQASSPIRTLDELCVREVPSWPYFSSEVHRSDHEPSSFVECNMRRLRSYVVTARAQSFLYHQVRLMVGALKAVGSGTLTVKDVNDILEARSISLAPPMAPACGLFLADVKYDLDGHL